MATTLLVCKNNATSTAAGAINNSSDPVTFSVASGEGALFPSAFPFHITIDNEILSCTARSTDSLTCSRAQQSTTIASHSSGATVELRVTAKSVSDLNTIANALEDGTALLAGRSGGQTLSGGTAASEGLTLNSTAHATKGVVTVGGGLAINATAALDSHAMSNNLLYMFASRTGSFDLGRNNLTTGVLRIFSAANANPHFQIQRTGILQWGPGTGALDNTLQRTNSTEMNFTQGLKVTGALETLSTLAVGTTMTVAGVASFNGSSVAVGGSLNFAATDGSSYLFTGTQSANPTVGAASQCKEYIKAAKKVFQYNDAGTTRYTTIDLTNGTVANSTTAP